MATRTRPLQRGEGTEPTQLANGNYRGRVTVNGKRESVTAKTRAEVIAIMRELRASDGLAVSMVPTLGEWCEEWLVDYSPDDVTENTTENYRWGLSKFEPLYGVAMDELERPHVEARLRELARGGLRRRSLYLARGHLAMAIDAYNDRVRLSYNPARKASIPKSAKGKIPRRTMTVEQGTAFLAAAAGHPHELALVLMLNLGLRPGEACGLPWSAVDPDAGQVDIVQFRRVTQSDDGPVVTMADPKANSDRPLALPPNVVAALRRHRTAQNRAKMAAAAWTDTGLVVTTGAGTAVDPANLRRSVRLIATRAGIDWTPALRPYELRHTSASLLVEQGVPLEEVADLLGNSVAVMVENYRHRSKRVVSAHVDHVEHLFG